VDPLEHWVAQPSQPLVPVREPYPVELVVVRSERASRLTTVFRAILLVLPLIFSLVLELVGVVVLAVGWLCAIFTGRLPRSLRAYLLWMLRYRAFVDCYAVLLTDRFPPTDGSDNPHAPIRVVTRAEEQPQPRWSVLLRGILALPLLFVSLCLFLVLLMAAIAAWSAIVVGGRLPSTIADVLEMGSGFILRTRAYVLLLAGRYPWFEHDAPDER
jgi:hypothetical protein